MKYIKCSRQLHSAELKMHSIRKVFVQIALSEFGLGIEQPLCKSMIQVIDQKPFLKKNYQSEHSLYAKKIQNPVKFYFNSSLAYYNDPENYILVHPPKMTPNIQPIMHTALS